MTSHTTREFLIICRHRKIGDIRPLSRALQIVLTLVRDRGTGRTLRSTKTRKVKIALPTLYRRNRNFFMRIYTMNFMLLRDHTSTSSLPQNAMTIRARLRANTFDNFRRYREFQIFTRRDNTRLYTDNRQHKGTHLPKGRRNFFFLYRSLVRLTSSQGVLPTIRHPANRSNVLAIGSRMIAIPMTSFKQINGRLNRLYQRLFSVKGIRLTLVFHESFRGNAISSLFFMEPLDRGGFSSNFVNSFERGLERDTSTIRVFRDDSSVLSSEFFEWSLGF